MIELGTKKKGKNNRSARTGATLLPDSWMPSERTLKRLGYELRLSPYRVSIIYLEGFKKHARLHELTYRDWDAAFRNCVRQDWLGIRAVPY